nr:uncharacterized protein LOC123494636 [Aegilops tauschii subsp. strangulata]
MPAATAATPAGAAHLPGGAVQVECVGGGSVRPAVAVSSLMLGQVLMVLFAGLQFIPPVPLDLPGREGIGFPSYGGCTSARRASRSSQFGLGPRCCPIVHSDRSPSSKSELWHMVLLCSR